MRRISASALAALVVLGSVAGPLAAEVSLPAKAKVHVYLLIGQSNMAGRGKVTDADKGPTPNVVMMDAKDAWVPARHPIHFDKSIAGFGLGLPFAKAMLEQLHKQGDDDAVIALVPCAFGGTPMRRWVKGGDLYKKAVERAKIAMKDGELRGVLWHQGESDSREHTHEAYPDRLASMVRDLRNDLDAPKLPVVVGELVPAFVARSEYAPAINTALKELPTKVKHTACASAKDLADRGDKLHFGRDALIEFGRRYAVAMLRLQKAETSEQPAAAPAEPAESTTTP